MLKPQLTWTPEDLAQIKRVAPGAQSDTGRRIIAGHRDPNGRLLAEPRRPVRPDPPAPPGRSRRRWGP